MKTDILAIGNAITDILCQIDDNFLEEHGLIKGSMSLIDEEMAQKLSSITYEKISAGGSASNTIAAMAQLGNSCHFIGKVGHDEFGEKFIKGLQEINCNFLTDKHISKPSARSFIFVSGDGERTMCTFLGCAPEISEDDIKEDFFKDL
ncbi:MAG: adenosine kinase, partial [Rickettsiales bacterium]|nr:adenosine kinase [Rickettsiales bacterium]